jgi:hypothetical protein
VDSKFGLAFHKAVKYPHINMCGIRRKMLRWKITPRQRRELKAKMAVVLKEDIKRLSKKFQNILLDDLITAFQNRLDVLFRVQKRRGYCAGEKELLIGIGEEKAIV